MTKPVLILQFMDDDAPAYLGTWLQRHGLASELRVATASEGFPDRIDRYAALALLGGVMSANDDLPFVRAACRLIEQAMSHDVPVLGHCLGGQLMAHVLGARVGASPSPEIGWHRIDRIDSPASREWLGPEAAQQVFQWHYEAFDLPADAQGLATSAQCLHQAFAIGPHLGLQFHVEVDSPKIDLWLGHGDAQYLRAQHSFDSVHPAERIRQDTVRLLEPQQRLADRIYRQWIMRARWFSH
ncbi:MAG: hypothetical protein LKCHEGNO_00324 [Burkholderiaceae bacterium]|nr:hypothetical protein [Burkholderiaceae bacterium]